MQKNAKRCEMATASITSFLIKNIEIALSAKIFLSVKIFISKNMEIAFVWTVL